MAATNDWDSTTPAGTEDANLIDDYLNDIKADLEERLEDMLYGFDTSTSEKANVPAAKKIIFKEQASISTPAAGHISLGAKEGADGDTVGELFAVDEDGNERQLTRTEDDALRLNVEAGDYAADSIDEDDIQLANNKALTAKNAAGDGTVNLILAGANDLPTLPDSAEMASNAAPTEDEGIANKKYVDDTAKTLAAYSAGAVDGITFPLTVTANPDTSNTDIAATKMTTAGFLLGRILAAGAGNSVKTIAGYCDSSNGSTLRTKVSSVEISGQYGSGSFCMPVKAGDYLKALYTSQGGSGGSCSRVYDWIPQS